MQFVGLRKHCESCGREIDEALKERRMLYDRLKIEKQLCIWCINKQSFERIK